MWRYIKELNLYSKVVGQQEFDTVNKLDELAKKKYNMINASYVVNQHQRQSHTDIASKQYLVLDAETAETSRTLCAEADVPRENITIVSRNVRFSTNNPDSAPFTHTGELNEYVDVYEGPPFDGVILDYCCTWNDDVIYTIHRIFQKHVVEEESFISITICPRKKNSAADANLYDRSVDAVMRGIPDIAVKYGYRAHMLDLYRNGSVFSMWFKVVNDRVINHKVHGRKRTNKAFDWMVEPVTKMKRSSL